MIALLLGCGADDGDDSGAGMSSADESTTATATTTVGSSTTQPKTNAERVAIRSGSSVESFATWVG